MGHNSIGRRQNNVSELTTRQKINDPLFDFTIFDIETRADHTTLVQSAGQFNDDLARPVIIDNFKFPNVSCVKLLICLGLAKSLRVFCP